MIADGPDDAHDWPSHDLQESVSLGLDRGQHLLTAGEHIVARRIQALTGEAQAVYARLAARKPLAFPLDTLAVPGVPDLTDAFAVLEASALVDGCVPWRWRAELSTRARLAAGCRRLGLKVSGSRGVLEARLSEHVSWDPSPWIRPRHRHLVRRLQRWATLSAWPAEHHAVLERMGQLQFVDYPLTTGALHRCRSHLLVWEATHAALSVEQITIVDALVALSSPRAPRGLDLHGWLVHGLLDHARGLERKHPDQAIELYDQMGAAGISSPRFAFRKARTLEALGQPIEALQVLMDAREGASRLQRLPLARAGRRLSRSLKQGFPPERPHRAPPTRQLQLNRVGAESRPLWTDAAVPVEDAVVAWLAAAGRTAVHVESSLWRSLFALIFADAYFLPVPGALPVPRLNGPLDLRSPSFRALRPLVDERLSAVLDGHAATLVANAWPTYGGHQISGLHPDLPESLLVAVALQTPPIGLHAILVRLLAGYSAGLPDLVVLDGPQIILDAHPTRLRTGLHLVEVKGPGDTLSDAQKVWIDELLDHELPVEVWQVRPT